MDDTLDPGHVSLSDVSELLSGVGSSMFVHVRQGPVNFHP
jgi:hypothetical protein